LHATKIGTKHYAVTGDITADTGSMLTLRSVHCLGVEHWKTTWFPA